MNSDALEMQLNIMKDRIETLAALNDFVMVRSFVNEAAIAYLIAGKPVDFEMLTSSLDAEFGGSQRGEWAAEALDSLRKRSLAPTAPLVDD